MASTRVTGYATFMYFDDQPRQLIQLISEGYQIGDIRFIDPALFNATIDMLRNEGPHITWDEVNRRIVFGLEPTGEGDEENR